MHPSAWVIPYLTNDCWRRYYHLVIDWPKLVYRKLGFLLLMQQTHNKFCVILVYLALTVATLAVYWQVTSHDFLIYDDDKYVTQNPIVRAGVTCQGLRWAFTETYEGNWHPVTWLSHMLDCRFFDLNPFWHHLNNLLFHIANTLLLFAILKTTTDRLWPSAFVAAAFALHPLHVESVAWVAERKDVLSTFFFMLTLAAYIRYTRQTRIGWYLLTLSLFAVGLMAKPMLVTLPFILLLLDYWPLSRFSLKKATAPANNRSAETPSQPSLWQANAHLLREKIPFFVLAVVAAVVTLMAEHPGVMSLKSWPITVRAPYALISYLAYILKIFWPTNMAVLYPLPRVLPLAMAIGAGILLLCITIRFFRESQHRGYLLVGWLWYLITLLPVIGILQVGKQIMADRYTYIPSIGLFILIAWFAEDFLSGKPNGKLILTVSAAAVLIALSICTFQQLNYWKDSEALFTHTIQVTEDNDIAHANLGLVLYRQDRVDEAVEHYRRALVLHPRYAVVHFNLGLALEDKGLFDEAVDNWRQAAQAVHDKHLHYHAIRNLGRLLGRQGKLDEALTYCRQALDMNPDDPDTNLILADLYTRMGRFDEADDQYHRALSLRANWSEEQNRLAEDIRKQLESYQAGKTNLPAPPEKQN